jgi:hypothetical protein
MALPQFCALVSSFLEPFAAHETESLGETKGATKKRQRESHTEEANGVTAGETEGITKKRQKESLRERQKEPQRRDRRGHKEETK